MLQLRGVAIQRAELQPDLTIILDVPAEEGLARATKRRGEAAADRFAELNPDEVARISQEVMDAMGNFFDLSNMERRWLRGVAPFYAWYKAIVGVTLALALLLPSAAGGAPSTANRKAVLGLATAQPVALRGSRFLSGERVTVVAASQGRLRTKVVTAGAAGTFLVQFVGLPFDRCEGFAAIARGSRGSFATYKLPDVMCPPRG